MNLSTKQKQTHRLRKQTYGSWGGGRKGGRDKLGYWDWHMLTTVYKVDGQLRPAV